jgi:hypothetical protein
MQFTPFDVECVILEQIAQATIPFWASLPQHPWRMKNKPPVRKM